MQNIIPDERYSVADEAILGAFFKLLKKRSLTGLLYPTSLKQLVLPEVPFIITIRTFLH